MELLHRILPFASKWLKWQLTPSEHFKIPTEDGVLMFCGDPPHMLTSLLFQAAISHVSDGVRVTYITREPLPSLPLPVHGMPTPHAEIMGLLKILYLPKAEDVVQYLAGIHALPVLPEVLLVDDIAAYTHDSQSESVKMQFSAKFCALLKDAQNFLCSKLGQIPVYTCSSNANPKMLEIYRKFFKNLMSLSATEDKMYQLEFRKRESTGAQDSNLSLSFHLRLKEDCIQLEDVHQASS